LKFEEARRNMQIGSWFLGSKFWLW
jgi:hypothetical protein